MEHDGERCYDLMGLDDWIERRPLRRMVVPDLDVP